MTSAPTRNASKKALFTQTSRSCSSRSRSTCGSVESAFPITSCTSTTSPGRREGGVLSSSRNAPRITWSVVRYGSTRIEYQLLSEPRTRWTRSRTLLITSATSDSTCGASSVAAR